MADLSISAGDWPLISRRLDEALLLRAPERAAWLAALSETASVKSTLSRRLAEAGGVETGDFLASLPRLTLGADARHSRQPEERKPHSTTVDALTARAGLALREGQLALASADARDALRLAPSLQGGTPWSVRTGMDWLIEGEIRVRSGAGAAAPEAFTHAVDHLSQAADPSHPALKRARASAAEGMTVSSR